MEPVTVYYFDGSFDESKSPSVRTDSAVHDVSQPSFADSIPHRQFELVELSSVAWANRCQLRELSLN